MGNLMFKQGGEHEKPYEAAIASINNVLNSAGLAKNAKFELVEINDVKTGQKANVVGLRISGLAGKEKEILVAPSSKPSAMPSASLVQNENGIVQFNLGEIDNSVPKTMSISIARPQTPEGRVSKDSYVLLVGRQSADSSETFRLK
jgi:hypothetical protein